MLRAVIEGITFGIRDSFELIKDLNIPINEVLLSGGGAKSEIWRKIITDVLNIKTHTANINEGSSFGTALLAGVGTGIFQSIEQACEKTIKIENNLTPNTPEAYNKNYAQYKKLYHSLKGLFYTV